MTRIIGIDPGLTGAVALYDDTDPTRIDVRDMPVVDRRVDGATLLGILEDMRAQMVVFELVGAMPKQTPNSMFVFGCAFGVPLGLVQGLRIPHRLVTPGKWKRHFGLDADKEKSRAMALRTFTHSPSLFARKKDEGRAEAALLALYGAHAFPVSAGEARVSSPRVGDPA